MKLRKVFLKRGISGFLRKSERKIGGVSGEDGIQASIVWGVSNLSVSSIDYDL